MENENVVADNLNTAEVVSPNETDSPVEESTDESVEDIKARLAKAEELAQNYKVRAEKAEKKSKETGGYTNTDSKTEKSVPTKSDLSQTDLFALIKSNVVEDDIPEILDYAKLKKISVSDALKSSFVKSFLKEKEENRNVAQATNTGATRRGSSKVSEEVLVSKASKGELPESDEDLIRLVRARKGLK